MGRHTPMLCQEICNFLLWLHILTYLEAILRVYNQYGRRDNIYKARIKILVKAIGIVNFQQQVETEWLNIKNGQSTLIINELQRVAQYFSTPNYITLPIVNNELEYIKNKNKDFFHSISRNVKLHKISGYAIIVLSLKKQVYHLVVLLLIKWNLLQI